MKNEIPVRNHVLLYYNAASQRALKPKMRQRKLRNGVN